MATGEVCKPNVATVHRVPQALIYTARGPPSRYGQVRKLQGKGGLSLLLLLLLVTASNS